MMVKIISTLLIINCISSQGIIINEFLASNVRTNPEMLDFVDYADWIELYNPTPNTISLENYFLSDDFDNPTMWKFPFNTLIDSDSYLLVWADGFDEGPGSEYQRQSWPWNYYITQNYHTNFKLSKSGEDLGLFKSEQINNEVLIQTGAMWFFNDQGQNLGLDWRELDYDMYNWENGLAELGYGDGDEQTIIDYGENSEQKHITTYFRHVFEINNSTDYSNLEISIKRDDGAVIFLNGEEVARSNMPDGYISFDTPANSSVSSLEEGTYYNYEIPAIYLQSGQNIVSVEVHQRSQSSSDVSFDFQLLGISYSNIQMVDQITFQNQIEDISYGIELESGEWKYFGEPTPGLINNTFTSSSTDQAGYLSSSHSSGFYDESIVFSLESNEQNDLIYYTLDGSNPSTDALLYDEPIDILNTTIVRANTFKNGFLPGNQVHVSLIISQNEPTLPVVSLIADPETLFGDEVGIYSNELKQREIPVYIDYFGIDKQKEFSIGAGARLGGLNIWTKPQKPFTIYMRNRFGTDILNYKLFADKQIDQFSRIVFRNGGDDWEETLFRDALTESLVKDIMECGYMSYQPSSLLLNGAYWGIYNIREKFDNKYFFENFNVDQNNIDHLEYTQTPDGVDLVVVEGDLNNFEELLNIISMADVLSPEFYNIIKQKINMNSFIDHIITILYAANTSWKHNREWWREKNEEAKWQWLIVDLDRGFDHNNINENLLDNLLQDYELFSILIENVNFKEYFLQRSAAHLNNTFNATRIGIIIDSLKLNIEGEIPYHINRWSSEGGISSLGSWNSELEEINQFASQRSQIILDQLNNQLNDNGFIEITINISDESYGEVFINDVSIKPQRTNYYFKDVPIDIRAVPKPGYSFLGWGGGINSTNIVYNCNQDTSIEAMFGIENQEMILSGPIGQDTVLTNDFIYIITNDLIVPNGLRLTIGEGVNIKLMPEKSILIYGSLNISGTAENPVLVTSHEYNSRWGAICFNNPIDTSYISYTEISGASNGHNSEDFKASISSLNSNLIIDNIVIENIVVPVFINGGSIKMTNSIISCEYTCDYINVVNSSDVIVSSSYFFGSNRPDTDAIDFDNVLNGVIENNKIYHFSGLNSDAIDIGENSNDILIQGNNIYHIADKAVSVGQNSTVMINDNLIVQCGIGVALKDNSQALIKNNTFFSNDTSIAAYVKNVGAGGGIAEVVNSIFSEGGPTTLFNDQNSNISVSHSLFDRNEYLGNENIYKSPLFVDASIYNFEFLPESPCLNSGITMNDGTPSNIGSHYLYNESDYPYDIFTSTSKSLRINELLASNESINSDENGDFDDWFEIFNPTSESIYIKDLYITDDLTNFKKFRFKDSTSIIPPNGFFLVWCDDELSMNSDNHSNFKISSSGETLALIDTNGLSIIDIIEFGQQSPDYSFARINDGVNPWVILNNPTPGTSNNILSGIGINIVPKNFSVSQNFPNPFNESTLLTYYLPIKTNVSINVYNLTGAIVDNFYNKISYPGEYTIRWSPGSLPSGVYFIGFITLNEMKYKKVLFVK